MLALVNILPKNVTFARDCASSANFLLYNCIEDDMVRKNWQNI